MLPYMLFIEIGDFMLEANLIREKQSAYTKITSV